MALATVADLVPLTARTGRLVRGAPAVLRAAPRQGLRALMAAAEVEPERLTRATLGFRLAPADQRRGTAYRADAGVELMLTADHRARAEIAAELDRANCERRPPSGGASRAPRRARAALPAEQADAPALVLAGRGLAPGRGWHRRLAARGAPLAPRRTDRLDGGAARGSARSIPGFDLIAALEACSEHLIRYGGHRAAAGLEMSRENSTPSARRSSRTPRPSSTRGPGPHRGVDALVGVGGESIGMDVAEQLERLAPVRHGQPRLRLIVPSGRIRDDPADRRGGQALALRLESGTGRAMGVAFGMNGRVRPTRTSRRPLRELELNAGTARSSPVWSCASSIRYGAGDGTREAAPGCGHGAPSDARSGGSASRPSSAPLRRVVPPALRRRPDAAPAATRWTAAAARRWPRSPSWSPAAPRCSRCAPTPRAAASWPKRRRTRRASGRRARAIACCALRRGRARRGARRRDARRSRSRARRLGRAGPQARSGRRLRARGDDRPAPVRATRAAGDGRERIRPCSRWGPAGAGAGRALPRSEWQPRGAVDRSGACSRTGAARRPATELRAAAGRRRAPPAPARGRGPRIAVLTELGLCEWTPGRASRALRAVSSERTDLERSQAFGACTARHEEGKQYLRKQPTSSTKDAKGRRVPRRRAADSRDRASGERPSRAARGRDHRRAERRPTRPARRPVRGDRGAQVRGRRADRPRGDRAGIRLRVREPRRSGAQVRRGLHHPPPRGGADLRRPAAGHRDALRGAAPRHGRGHQRQPR